MPQGKPDKAGKPITGTDGDDTLAPVDPSVAAKINGGDGNDSITGSDQGDEINAGDGNDTITGGGGDDDIKGNDGDDTAVYAGSVFDFLISAGSGNAIIVDDTNPGDGDEGTDTLKHIETLQFSDFTYKTGENNAPVVLVADQSTDEDSPTSFTFDVFDFDGGTLSLDAFTVSGGALSVSAPVAVTAGNYDGLQYTLTFDPEDAFQYLAVNETASVDLSLQVSDGQGGVTTVMRTISIAGLNDPVVIDQSGSDLVGEVTEDESDPILNEDGSIFFKDVDLSDTHEVAESLSGVTGLTVGLEGADPGTFLDTSISDTSGVEDGTVTWNFEAENDLFQYLGNGDSVTISYEVSISDGNGETATETVEVTVNGVNDDPEFVGGDIAGEVIEDTLLSVGGSLVFEDVDFGTELFGWSVAGGGVGNYGTMAVDLFGNWTYTLNNTDPDVQDLNLDETLTDGFIFNISDGDGGTASQAVTITIVGLDDGENVINPLLHTFEDGVSGGPGGLVYGGGWGTVDATDSDGRGGNPYGPLLLSGSFVANNGGNDVTISRDTNFDLESASFISPFDAGVSLVVTGFDDGVSTGSQTISLSVGVPSLVSFDNAIFDSVDEVTFESAGAFFGMENLLIIG